MSVTNLNKPSIRVLPPNGSVGLQNGNTYTNTTVKPIAIHLNTNLNSDISMIDGLEAASKYYLNIGNLKLTLEEYETCMTYLLEMTKKNRPEEFI